LLESGAARHNLRKQIPAARSDCGPITRLLPRDLEELQNSPSAPRFSTRHNSSRIPGAQVTQSVKQLKSEYRLRPHRHAAGESPAGIVEHRGLHPTGATSAARNNSSRRTSRGSGPRRTWRQARRGAKRRSPPNDRAQTPFAKLRPLLLPPVKKHVAKDLPPHRQRAIARWGDEAAELYLGEIAPRRDQNHAAVAEQGLNKSKMHVWPRSRDCAKCAAIRNWWGTIRRRKTRRCSTLLDSLIAEARKVLRLLAIVADALHLLEKECVRRHNSARYSPGQTKDRQEV